MADSISSLSDLADRATLVNNQDTVDADEHNTTRTAVQNAVNLLIDVVQEQDDNYASTTEPTLKSEGKIFCDTTNDPAEWKGYKDGSSNTATFMTTDNVQSTVVAAQDRNIVIQNGSTATQEVDITFDSLTFYNSSGAAVVGSQTSALTLDVDATGAGGRAVDVTAEGAGTEQISTKYFIHLYNNGSGTINGIFSTNASWEDVASSDKPSGSDFVRSLRLAYVYNDSGGDFVNFKLIDSIRTADDRVINGAGNGSGSINTKIRRWSNTDSNIGNAITYADSSTLGASYTINVNGIYNIYYSDGNSQGGITGISLNSTELTTNANDITKSDLLSMARLNSNQANSIASCYWTGFLKSGDVIRPHHAAAYSSTNAAQTRFDIRLEREI